MTTEHVVRPRAAKHGAAACAVSAGGGLGAAARYGVTLLWPTATGAFPWTILLVNTVGCALIGVLMVVVAERFSPNPLVRIFLGPGVLGGFTTFSTYSVDVQQLFHDGHTTKAALYLVSTAVAALAAVWTAMLVTRRVLR